MYEFDYIVHKCNLTSVCISLSKTNGGIRKDFEICTNFCLFKPRYNVQHHAQFCEKCRRYMLLKPFSIADKSQESQIFVFRGQ